MLKHGHCDLKICHVGIEPGSEFLSVQVALQSTILKLYKYTVLQNYSKHMTDDIACFLSTMVCFFSSIEETNQRTPTLKRSLLEVVEDAVNGESVYNYLLQHFYRCLKGSQLLCSLQATLTELSLVFGHLIYISLFTFLSWLDV